MATLIPWTTIEVGELEIFAPAVPCLVVNTWYADGGPISTVTYFWQDDETGMIRHEIVFAESVDFEDALAWAQGHAPTRGVERIHVKHGPAKKRRGAAARVGARKKGRAQTKKSGRSKAGRTKRARKASTR